MEHEIVIPRSEGTELTLRAIPQLPIVILGANGAGKTRLCVHIENQLATQSAVLRIPAHKSLVMNDQIQLVALERAQNALRFGYAEGESVHRIHMRWGSKPAVHLLNDFDALLQTLFAEHNRVAVRFLEDARRNSAPSPPSSALGLLKASWEKLFPHRTLVLNEASIAVRVREDSTYPASEMSDGERAIFYCIGQCLVAPENACIIVDEPEAHVHKAVLAMLWDQIENLRADCAFIYVTHDLDFASQFIRSTKISLYRFDAPARWDVDFLPDDLDLPEPLVAQIAGSRRPVLFVEGERGSLDAALYGACYPDFLILPVGGCEAVTHSVATYNSSSFLHRLKAFGVVDADGRTPDEIRDLETSGVYSLPVAEIENILLLPSVFNALADALHCDSPASRLERLTDRIATALRRQIDQVSARYTARLIDSKLKHVTLTTRSGSDLVTSFAAELSAIDPQSVFRDRQAELESLASGNSLPDILRVYDNKGLLAEAARVLDIKGPKALLQKVTRLLTSEGSGEFRECLLAVLPNIPIARSSPSEEIEENAS